MHVYTGSCKTSCELLSFCEYLIQSTTSAFSAFPQQGAESDPRTDTSKHVWWVFNSSFGYLAVFQRCKEKPRERWTLSVILYYLCMRKLVAHIFMKSLKMRLAADYIHSLDGVRTSLLWKTILILVIKEYREVDLQVLQSNWVSAGVSSDTCVLLLSEVTFYFVITSNLVAKKTPKL